MYRGECVGDDVAIIDGEDDKHEGTFFFADWAAAPSHEPEQSSGCYHHDDIDHFEAFWLNTTENSDRETEHYADIEDVATNNITDQKFVFAAFGSGNSGDKFWEGGAKGNHGESDDAVGNSDDTGEIGSGSYN